MKSILLSISLLIGGLQFSNAQCHEKILEAFGGTSAVALYNTYITIGAIADGYVSDVYDAAKVEELMLEQESMMEVLSGYFDELTKENSVVELSEEDTKYINEMITCLDYLKMEATGLKEYAATNSDESLDKYNEGRDNSWTIISELLGLE